MKKAMIAMSGGVDSSVAAWLMKRDGYDCMGVTMRLFAGEDSCERKGHTCCSLDDVEDARSVARQLGIPYFVFNFTEDFGTQIMDRFVCAYENGFTPNPCIDCNRYMKFEKLMKRAQTPRSAGKARETVRRGADIGDTPGSPYNKIIRKKRRRPVSKEMVCGIFVHPFLCLTRRDRCNGRSR